jgi:hypothetical protein
MAAQRLVGLAVDHRDDVIFRRERLAHRNRWREFLPASSVARSRVCRGRSGGELGHCRVHRAQKRRHVFGGCAVVLVAEPRDREFRGKLNRIQFVFVRHSDPRYEKILARRP